MQDPKPLYKWMVDMLKGSKAPTYTHMFFAHLEKLSKLSALVTQNLDGLELRAGLLIKLENFLLN